MKKIALLSLALLLACSKDPEKAAPAPDPTPSASVATTASPLASSVPPPPVAVAVSASASAPASASASASAPTKAKDGGAATTALKPASTHIDGKNFALDVASPGCKANDECTMTIKLVASSEYHVNKEYPYKFLATAAPGVTFLGKKDANTFAKDSGDFAEQGEKTATMTVRFKPTTPGEAKVAGTYKMSVCSADQCQIEVQPVSLSVPVM